MVNKAVSIGIAPAVSGTSGGVDELVAIFFIVELLKIVENLHQKGFIHGDLKIDNCLIRLEDIPSSQGGPSSWSSTYHSDGQEGWSFKGLKLIDFGRGIDFELFERGRSQRFVADWKVDERDCWEVREGREWAWESDYYGLAGVAYCLLFGKYIQSEMVEGTDEGTGKKYKISTPLKRVSSVFSKLCRFFLFGILPRSPCPGRWPHRRVGRPSSTKQDRTGSRESERSLLRRL